MLKQLPSIIEALYRGRQLANVETWKVAGAAAAALSGLLSALVGIAVSQGWLSNVSPETIMEVSSALVTLVSAVLTYLQIATTKKIGLSARGHDPDDASGDSGLRGDEVPARNPTEHRDPFGSFKS
jgi:hypothetical protein